MENGSIQEIPDWYNQRLADGGPVYMETDLGHMIAEPWNAVSSLLIILPAVYWLYRIGSRYRDFRFLLSAIPLIILGGTGSMLFHAFRAFPAFLYMDFIPPALLAIALMVYFWTRILRKWWYILFIILLSLATRFLLFYMLEPSPFMAINISYTITGAMIGLPVLLLLSKTGFYRWRDVVLTILFFIAAIIFRESDSREIGILPMGTHFLWHAFTGFGGYFLLSYLYHLRSLEAGPSAGPGEGDACVTVA